MVGAVRGAIRTSVMIRFFFSVLVPAALAGTLAVAPTAALAQLSESELVMRLNRLENQVRQLTGGIEQLQYRNQQLEQQLRRQQEDFEFRMQELSGRGGRPAARPATAPAQPTPGTVQQSAPPSPQQTMPPQQQAPYQPGPPTPTPPAGRRGDAFDPNQNPNAPGAPRTLGAPGTMAPPPPGAIAQEEEEQVGAPGGRQAGGPLDLGTMSSNAVNDPSLAPRPASGEIRTIPGALPPPPPRSSANAQMVMAPSQSPKDEYDLAYGYILRKDYALAEDSLRAFIRKHPSDRMVPDANYWLGESLFQRQRYREAAESFLIVPTKFETSNKAPEALLRLAQSLAALREKESACATLGEISRKYPRAPQSVKQAAEREQKRAGC